MCGYSLQLQLFGNHLLRISNYERWFVLLQCWCLQLVLCTYGRSMFRKHSAIDICNLCDVRFNFLLTVGSCTRRLLTKEKVWRCLANKAENSNLQNLHMFCVRPCIEQNRTRKDRLKTVRSHTDSNHSTSDMASDRTEYNLQQRRCKNLKPHVKSLSAIPSSFRSAKSLVCSTGLMWHEWLLAFWLTSLRRSWR